MGVPPNGVFIRENPIVMDDLGIPPFMETTIYIHMFCRLHHGDFIIMAHLQSRGWNFWLIYH